jgi:hypothetical protein
MNTRQLALPVIEIVELFTRDYRDK